MKTITLTDEAYARIAELKTSPKDSFSKVILRSIPRRGTAGQLLEDVRSLPALSPKAERAMVKAVGDQRARANWRDAWKRP